MQFAGLHGPRTHSRYLASIGIWVRQIDKSSAHHFESNALSLYALDTPFEIVDMDDNANFDMILGFDILKQFDFGFDHSTRMFEIIVSR